FFGHCHDVTVGRQMTRRRRSELPVAIDDANPVARSREHIDELRDRSVRLAERGTGDLDNQNRTKPREYLSGTRKRGTLSTFDVDFHDIDVRESATKDETIERRRRDRFDVIGLDTRM